MALLLGVPIPYGSIGKLSRPLWSVGAVSEHSGPELQAATLPLMETNARQVRPECQTGSCQCWGKWLSGTSWLITAVVLLCHGEYSPWLSCLLHLVACSVLYTPIVFNSSSVSTQQCASRMLSARTESCKLLVLPEQADSVASHWCCHRCTAT